jgi:hypothetical protein
MARELGVSKATVQRVWSENEIKPHLTRVFKLSTDPAASADIRTSTTWRTPCTVHADASQTSADSAEARTRKLAFQVIYSQKASGKILPDRTSKSLVKFLLSFVLVSNVDVNDVTFL